MSVSRTRPRDPQGDLRHRMQGASTAEGPAQRPRKWRLKPAAALVSVIALAGACIFLYPATAAWFTQLEQSNVVASLQSTTVSAGAAEARDALAAAYAYNQGLVAGAVLEANARKPVAEGEASDGLMYNSLLRGDAAGAMGRLRIDKIAVDLPIYHGTSDATLEKGVGHLQGTSLPVGGESQHSVLTAHRGLAEATLFDRLDELRSGDTFQIEVFGDVLTYRVFETKVVDPNDTESLYPRLGEDLVTLVTCTPLGINTHRILVTGERVLPTPVADIERAGEASDLPGFPWWVLGLGGTAVAIGVYLWRSGHSLRNTP